MGKNTEFYLRLSQLIEESQKSWNQVERELKYPRNALNNYKYGKEPSGRRLVELARYFSVSPEYLMGQKDTRTVPTMTELFSSFNEMQCYEILRLYHQKLLKKNSQLPSNLKRSEKIASKKK